MVNRGDEADAVLRAVVDLLHDRLEHVSWAGISLVEGGALELGPAMGSRATDSRLDVAIDYEGRVVGEIALESDDADAFDEEERRAVRRIAMLISQHALVAWDTRGVGWNP
jgi:putative methionine-R-sulfoxide reductase with GAF domain